MQGILHSLQIGTLSTWLSLTTFGTVGVVVHPWHASGPAPLPAAEETEITPNDFLLEAPTGPAGDNLTAAPTETLPLETEIPEPIPAPPELAPLAELTPLPEIPDLPPSPPPISAVREAHEAPRSSNPSTSASTPRPSATRNTGARSSSSNSSSATTGSGHGGNSAATTASRLAAGRMPAPAYPASAKRAGQTGTVVVEFTIGTDGRVISAYAKSPSPHAALNEAAVRTVRRWKFPPGGVLKTQRPIIFQLR
jgi:protein TonB